MMEHVVRLDDWFRRRLSGLRCEPTTLAYVVNVFAGFRTTNGDMSQRSLILMWAEARASGNFETFQRIGDWALWTKTFCPSFVEAHPEVTRTVGQLAYLSCHRLIRWPLYEELADNLETITTEARTRLKGLDLG